MTALGHAALRQLALKVLAQHTGSAAGAEAVAAAAQRAYDHLAHVSAPLIGQVGVDALAARALHLAQRQYPQCTRPVKAWDAARRSSSVCRFQPPTLEAMERPRSESDETRPRRLHRCRGYRGSMGSASSFQAHVPKPVEPV